METLESTGRFAPIPHLGFGGTLSTQELPLLVVVLSDLRGDTPPKPQSTKPKHMDLDNIWAIMHHIRPTLRLTIDFEESKLPFDLEFSSLSDFAVKNIIQSNPTAKEMFEFRDTLSRSTHASSRESESVVKLSDEQLAAIQRAIGETSPVGDPVIGSMNVTDEIRSLHDPSSHLLNRTLVEEVIHRIDNWLSRLITAVLENTRFKALEQRWASLNELCKTQSTCDHTKLRVCDITLTELIADSSKGSDQSWLGGIFEEERLPGGTPIGLILGDYELDVREPACTELLKNVAHLCASNFAVFVTAVAPESFGLDSYSEPLRRRQLEYALECSDNAHWKALRSTPESRHIGLCLPRIKIRYRRAWVHSRHGQFEYHPPSEGLEDSFTGNAAYGFVATVLKSHSFSGWPVDCVGARTGQFNDTDFPLYGSCNANGSSTGMQVSLELAEVIRKSGFILCAHDQQMSAPFVWDAASVSYEWVSFHDTQGHSKRMRVSIPHLISVCRLANSAMVRATGKSGVSIAGLKLDLENWLNNYITSSEIATSPEKPLISGNFEVVRTPKDLHIRLNLVAGFRFLKPLDYTFLIALEASQYKVE